MDALKIALETMIVGALALPWMFLLVDLFCPEKEQLIHRLLELLNNTALAAVAGTVALSLAYFVGASVGRVADDFSNDDDLHLPVTEDAIRTSVYCDPSQPWLIHIGARLSVDNQSGTGFATPCTAATITTATDADQHCAADRDNCVRQVFSVQEASLLLTSTGNTDRLRYQHQQLVVLRGVTLDGFLITLLCLFGFCAQNHPWGRGALFLISAALLVWSIYAWHHHLHEHLHNIPGEPPLMESVLTVISLAGFSLMWKTAPKRPYRCAFMFSAVLTLLAYAGWWYSEIVYDHTVLFFFYSHAHATNTLIQ